MKQFVQNLKVLRTMPGRFLSVAVVVAAALTINAPAQADPGREQLLRTSTAIAPAGIMANPRMVS